MFKKTLPLVAAIAIAIAPAVQSENMFSGKAKPNSFWWPDQVDLSQLRDHDAKSNPYGDDFNYAKAFSSVDLKTLKADIEKVLTRSQDWWPADWGHYGGLMIRMAWHSAGPTAYMMDGAVPMAASSDSSHSTAGLITPAWTRHAACCGRSSRNTGVMSPGLT